MRQAIQQIQLSKLIPSDANVRHTGRMNGVGELAASIKAHGLLQNLTVRRVTKGKKQEVKCTSSGAKSSSRTVLELVRDHKVVAHGTGRLGSEFQLRHAHALHGQYTLFVAIPGVTTSSQKVHLS